MSERVESVPASSEPPGRSWASSGMVAGLWLLATLLHILQQLLFPGHLIGSLSLSPLLYLASGPILAAFAASAIGRAEGRLSLIAASLLIVDCAASLCWLAFQAGFASMAIASPFIDLFVIIAAVIASGKVVAVTLRGVCATGRRAVAALAAMCIVGATPLLTGLDEPFALRAADTSSLDRSTLPPKIDQERLWTSQRPLVDQALGRLDLSHSPAGDAYLVTVGAGGSQLLFGREARFARTVLSQTFGAQKRSLILSNDQPSLYRIPLAANSNLGPLLAAVGQKMNPARDLLVIYLSSHGSRKAELMTDLPDYEEIEPIGAKHLADQLDRAHIRRRVIIVSACFGGSWIKPLANDDTIIIAAARQDRTSFGCSNERELTYFGEAFLKAPVAATAPLAVRFESARRQVAQWEARSRITPSQPQAYVGRNMQQIWRSSPVGQKT